MYFYNMQYALKKIYISYASHINNYNDLSLLEHSLYILSKNCKMIVLTYSINSSLTKSKITNALKNLKEKIGNFKFFKIENIGYDFKKHYHSISKFIKLGLINKDNYVIIMNDSVIPINSITLNRDFCKIASLMVMGFEFVGFLASKERKEHYQSWLWSCDFNTTKWIMENIENKNYSNKEEIINHIEIELSNKLMGKKRCLALYDFKTKYNIFYYEPNLLIEALDSGFPFIKKNYFSTEFRKKNNISFSEEINKYVPKNIKNIL